MFGRKKSPRVIRDIVKSLEETVAILGKCKAQTCGICDYWEPGVANNGRVVGTCMGVPPTPARNSLDGKIEMVSPKTDCMQRSCAAFKYAEDGHWEAAKENLDEWKKAIADKEHG